MRKKLPLIPAAILAVAVAAWCAPTPPQAQDQSQAQQSTAQKQQKEDSLVEAARRAREQKKTESKPSRVFTNDDIPTQGGVSTVGQAAAPQSAASSSKETSKAAAPTESNSSSSEQAWRKKFADLRQKLQQDQADLAVMQRELGVLNLQQYNDPVKAMQQQLSREDINKKTADIDAKKKAIEADQQAIAEAEQDLRKSGGDAGWAR
ncbi:MAG TPA: hypothetical protein VN661_10825 [Candidatus Acidoferrales bacterium]|nr:hypothetical protein [Candidatus Acidoferrales bacterium]